jgi:hypothetical protein
MRIRVAQHHAVLSSNTLWNMKTSINVSRLKRMVGGVSLFAMVFLSGCLADIRTSVVKKEGSLAACEAKGREILDRAWKAQGADKMYELGSYSYEATDHWKGMMGKMGKPWPNALSEMAFKHNIGTFDAQVTFQNGKRAGEKAGLQSWHYYEVAANGTLAFRKTNKRIQFGISAFQYFFELVDRLRNAPLIRYAGQSSVAGQPYDLVFVTWNKLTPHSQDDQYVVYVNRTSGLAEYAVYTLRQNYLPGAGMLHGTIAFKDFRAVDGILIPHLQYVYIGGPKRNQDAFVHRFELRNFQFDEDQHPELHPDPKIAPVGDSKVQPAHSSK